VETQPPTWELAKERCPCCDRQGELLFSACPTCGFVVLICAEVGTVFEAHDQKRGQQIGGSFGREQERVCAQCGKTGYSNFRNATVDEIVSLGFRPGDYR